MIAPGQNFGRTMLKVDWILENNHGESEPLHVVNKPLPKNGLQRTNNFQDGIEFLLSHCTNVRRISEKTRNQEYH